MPKLTDVMTLLVQEVKDLYSAENQLTKALPKMAKAASSPDLKKAFTDHLEETKNHAARLEQVAELLGASPRGKACAAMKGLIEEGSETIEEEGEAAIKDLALIAAAQRVEHYEISAYGTARALARALGLKQAADLLQATLDEEGAADKGLTKLADKLLPAAVENKAS